ncbi:MAG: M61 family metallopeptidase [Phycisphaerales bacterium]
MRSATTILSLILSLCSLTACAQNRADSTLHINATDLPRLLLTSTQTIPLDSSQRGTELPLWYPKWVPGSHAPGGPVHNIAGFAVTDQDGNDIKWSRTPGEVYRFIVHTPQSATEINIEFRYITNQSTSNSHGLDSWGADAIGLISPNTVLVYPEGARDGEWMIETQLTVPDDWQAACALDIDEEANSDASYSYQPVSVRRLVDTPIMLGRYYNMYSLNEDGVDAPPHRLHVFSEMKSQADIHPDVVDAYSKMVTQADRLFGSYPFPSMDILLATTNALPRNGLEHLRTTMNIIPLNRLDELENLSGWDQMLVPHEYVHAWCGKYRRPAGMATSDFHTPKGTELLWVYEGLTQYLGELLEVRSGMSDLEQYRWDMLRRYRSARLTQGRDWRPLADTCSASHTLRGGSSNWGSMRRGQDYYAEGALIWMEADAIIRNETDGAKSIEDFCHAFFLAEQPTDEPNPYTRDDVIAHLNDVVDYDWETFITERIDNVGGKPLAGTVELGYSIQYTNEPPTGPNNGRIDPLDARDSLGMSLSGDGTVRTVILGSPADKAGLAPRMRIMGIDGHTWSRQRFADLMETSAAFGSIELMTVSGDRISTTTINYEGGPRYMTLVRDESKPDVLADILQPID